MVEKSSQSLGNSYNITIDEKQIQSQITDIQKQM